MGSSSKSRGWVNVSVQTYQSQRNSSSRILQQDYTVDESGATLNALARNSEGPEAEEAREARARRRTPHRAPPARGARGAPFREPLRSPCLQLSGRRAFIRFDREDNVFCTPGFPCSRGDVFLKVGMRGARLIPWRLQEGDIFRLGQAYVLVSKIRLEDDAATQMQLVQDAALPECVIDEDERDTDVEEEEGDGDLQRPQCYICYESGCHGNPLLNLCQCTGTVKYVHLQCLQRWMQPEGSSAVNTHCPICKAKYPESAQAMMIHSPAIMLESWSNHRTLKLRHWISFNRHSTASLGRFSEHNDVSIPDHSVSGARRPAPRARLHHPPERPVLAARPRVLQRHLHPAARSPQARLWRMKMGKSLLSLHAKRTRWSRLRMRLQSLRLGGDARHESTDSERTERDRVTEAAERASLASQGGSSGRLSDGVTPAAGRPRSRVMTMTIDD
ncbi:hypothetical protein EMIHUDRAFT_441401 [Emiliania huxleyi CCMP1516]|uniref:RING-CH-type domain-containing protein n=2 Tax=Emiliania huxleyi TaxID=2903 RepID=A0A0D3KDV9_EMIH1|nr:hypothetical protein EMIHUDRAFT_441401 [Emiliania huxleyi CCMP1516]EOD33944.1 hypothetical protein EMIHUDRAFT_441401 [Emiliania huxleyi CCMP1516]|eukprot:XP_005786373.1 hypothetical protein EMIHUDRAFT_441401 [Emiliania huxleyi CCMP1516]